MSNSSLVKIIDNHINPSDTVTNSDVTYAPGTTTVNTILTEITNDDVNLREQIGLHIIAWVSTVIATCGVFGNILGAAVLHRMQKTNSNVRLLKNLSLVDIVLLVLVFLGVILFDLSSTIHAIFYPFAYLLAMAVYTFEIYLTVLIAIQRCMAIALPFKYESFMRASVINTILGCIAVFTVAFNVPLWLVLWPQPYWNTELNMQLFNTNIATSLLGEYNYTVYISFVTFVFGWLIPLIILVTCNIILVISRRRMKSGNRQSSDRGSVQLTMLVVAITSMSVFPLVVFVAEVILIHRGLGSTAGKMCLRISVLLIVINSSTNFIFYYAFGNTFVENLKSCFRSDD